MFKSFSVLSSDKNKNNMSLTLYNILDSKTKLKNPYIDNKSNESLNLYQSLLN